MAMTSPELKQLHEKYRKAIEVVRDEANSDETRATAQADVIEMRRELDENLIAVTERAEREEDEARARAEEIAHQAASAPPVKEPVEPTAGEKFRKWRDDGSPSVFRIAVMPDYKADMAAAGNKRVDVQSAQIDGRYEVDGRDWTKSQHVEKRTDIVTSDAGTVYSSYLVPARTDKSLSWHENAMSGILQAGPTIIQTPGDETLYMPKFLTDATATHHDEAAAATVTNPVLARMTLNSYRYDGFFSVSTEMLRSSILDTVGILQNAANRAIATAVASALATGSGTDLPQGLAESTTTTTAGKTSSTSTSFSMDDLKALKLSVLPGYRAGASWIFGTNAYGMVDTLTDDDGRYLWNPSNIAGEPNTLLGKPVFEDAGLPDITSAKKGPVLFGDISYYIVRYVGAVIFEASEIYQYEKFLTTFRFAKWIDADLLDTGAVKHLLMAT